MTLSVLLKIIAGRERIWSGHLRLWKITLILMMKKNAKTTVLSSLRGMTIINESGLYILTGLTDPNFRVSKSHCFHDKMVYWVHFWTEWIPSCFATQPCFGAADMIPPQVGESNRPGFGLVDFGRTAFGWVTDWSVHNQQAQFCVAWYTELKFEPSGFDGAILRCENCLIFENVPAPAVCLLRFE